MFPFPTPCKGKSKSQPFAHTFALTGRRRLCIDTQGVALGWGLVGLSARAGPQTRLFPHNLHQLDISILNTLAASGVARTFGEGLRRSTVAHFARKVRGTNIVAAKHELKIQRRYAPERWLYSLRVRGPHFASKVSYNAGAATDDYAGQRKSPQRGRCCQYLIFYLEHPPIKVIAKRNHTK